MCCHAMIDQKKLQLVLEHAQLTAQHAAGHASVRARIEEIEAFLQLTPVEIAQIAIGNYTSDY